MMPQVVMADLGHALTRRPSNKVLTNCIISGSPGCVIKGLLIVYRREIGCSYLLLLSHTQSRRHESKSSGTHDAKSAQQQSYGREDNTNNVSKHYSTTH